MVKFWNCIETQLVILRVDSALDVSINYCQTRTNLNSLKIFNWLIPFGKYPFITSNRLDTPEVQVFLQILFY